MEISKIAKLRAAALDHLEQCGDPKGFSMVRKAFDEENQLFAEANAQLLAMDHWLRDLSRPRGVMWPDGKWATWTGRSIEYGQDNE